MKNFSLTLVCGVALAMGYAAPMCVASFQGLVENSPFGKPPPAPKVVERAPTPVAPPKPIPITLEFRGVVVLSGETRCILWDTAKKKEFYVGLRDKSEPYHVVSYDPKNESIVVKFFHGERVLPLVDPLKAKKSSESSWGKPSSEGSDRCSYYGQGGYAGWNTGGRFEESVEDDYEGGYEDDSADYFDEFDAY